MFPWAGHVVMRKQRVQIRVFIGPNGQPQRRVIINEMHYPPHTVHAQGERTYAYTGNTQVSVWNSWCGLIQHQALIPLTALDPHAIRPCGKCFPDG